MCREIIKCDAGGFLILAAARGGTARAGKKKQHGHAITENPSLNMDLSLQLAREHTVLMMMHLEVKRTKSY